MLMRIAPAIPPSSVRPPFHSASMSPTPSNSEKWPITKNSRAPMIVPISAQNTIVLMCSTVTPRLGPSCCRIHAPNRNPTAIPMPCGLMAKSPNRWMRSRTGQPIEASTWRVYRRSSSNAAATLLPSRIPPATSDGKWTPTYTRDVPIVAASPSSAARAIGPAPEVSRRHGEEREQDGGMAARPRGAVRAFDAQVHPVEAGVVGAGTAEHALEPLPGDPGDRGRGQPSGGRPAVAGRRQHRGRTHRGPDRGRARSRRGRTGPRRDPGRGCPRGTPRDRARGRDPTSSTPRRPARRRPGPRREGPNVLSRAG